MLCDPRRETWASRGREVFTAPLGPLIAATRGIDATKPKMTCGFVVVADSLQTDGGRPGRNILAGQELRSLGVEFNINLVLAASRQGSLARQANLDGKRHLTSDASYRRQVSALAICASRSEIGQP